MSKEDYKREYLELFDFSEQIRSICNLKTGIDIDPDVAFKNDREVHIVAALQDLATVSVAYCLIGDDVAVMAAQGEIWVVYNMNLGQYEPTPAEVQMLITAGEAMGFDLDAESINIVLAEVDVVQIAPGSDRLH